MSSSNKEKNLFGEEKLIDDRIKKIDSLKCNVIDIGSGYGESTLEIAKSNPSKFVITCEKYIDGINKISENEQNTDFDTFTDFLDFTENNPFGDPE